MAYILLYVDDIVLTSSFDALRQSIMSLLASKFSMKDLGPLSYFLGIAVTRHIRGLFLCYRQYAEDIFERADALQYLTFTRPDISYVVNLPRHQSILSANLVSLQVLHMRTPPFIAA